MSCTGASFVTPASTQESDSFQSGLPVTIRDTSHHLDDALTDKGVMSSTSRSLNSIFSISSERVMNV